MMKEPAALLRPSEVCNGLLKTLDASEGQSRRRKRDQTADAVGLGIRRALLERAVAADPDPEAFEGWLMAQVLAAPAGGPVRSMCAQILDEYRFAAVDPRFHAWLQAGAPSADAEPDARPRGSEEVLLDALGPAGGGCICCVPPSPALHARGA